MANLRAKELLGEKSIARNRRRIKVFLEGQDDFRLFETYWFSDQKEKIEFCKAEDGPVEQSGCRGVLANVRNYREETGTAAFGIVDRDALMSENLLQDVSNADDQAFLDSNQQRNPYIYCTLYWEVENYLIAAKEMEQVRYDSQSNPEPLRPEESVQRELREHCDALIPHAAINAYLHEHGKPKVNDGCTNAQGNRADVDSFFRANHLASLSQEEIGRYQEWVSSVDAFDDLNKSDQERIRLMQRRIHGKALLQRFFRRRNIQSEVRWHLARQCTKPQEIEAKLQEWINSQ